MSTRKTTDLERLTQPGGKVLPDDATIPVLTERLTLPSLELDISLPQPPPPVVAPPSPVAAPPPPPPAPRPAPPSPPPVAAPRPAPALVLPPITAKPAAKPIEEPRTEVFPPTIPADGPTTVPLATTVPLETPTTVTVAAPAPIEINWSNAEARVREALLRELQPKLAADIDRHLRERLQPTVVRMLLATITELRPAIDAAIRDVVERAVAAEIARQRK